MNVLVVEDEEVLSFLWALWLTDRGHVVTTVNSRFRHLRDEHDLAAYDAAIVDYHLTSAGGPDGVEVCSWCLDAGIGYIALITAMPHRSLPGDLPEGIHVFEKSGGPPSQVFEDSPL